jgi:hemerythrin-like metal-binding protein
MSHNFTAISLGVALMDREHRGLVALFDAFEQCFAGDSQLEEAERLAGEALILANDHFEHEEALMAESQYPGIAEHKFHHRNLRLQFTTLVDDTIANIRRHDPVTFEHLDVMRRLLHEHIMGPDAALAAHVKTVELAHSEAAL